MTVSFIACILTCADVTNGSALPPLCNSSSGKALTADANRGGRQYQAENIRKTDSSEMERHQHGGETIAVPVYSVPV
ncbi:MAG: hypothetical protein CMJ77_04345 [Planctomycetaceae bacterium]|nr:hypothetical protein [Planctomycetaceae bacterium]